MRACAFSPDSRRIVSASGDRTLKLWDAESGAELATLEGHAGPVSACACSPDGRRIVSGSQDGTLKLWDADSGAELRTLSDYTGRGVVCAFSPDGRRIVSARGGQTLNVWDAESAAVLLILEGHDEAVHACAFSPGGLRIVSASGGSKRASRSRAVGLHLRRKKTESVLDSLNRWAHDTSKDTGSIKIWDAESGAQLRSLEPDDHAFRACALSPDGRLIVSAADSGPLEVWDAEPARRRLPLLGRRRSRPRRRLYGRSGTTSSCTFSPDGRWIVSASEDGTLKVWEAESGAELATLEGHAGPVSACAYSPNGRRIVSASGDRTLKVWDAEAAAAAEADADAEGRPSEPRREGRPRASSADGRRVVSADVDRTELVLWGGFGSEPRTLTGHTGWVTACMFSPDDRRILSASEDATLKLWDAESGAELATLEGHTGAVSACAYSPDGELIVSAGEDATLKLWDAESGAELATLEGHARLVTACAFSPDGQRIVSASSDKTLTVWDVGAGAIEAVLSLPGALLSVALHRWLPRGVCEDTGGRLHRVELVGIEYGPIVVTATGRRRRPVIRCPACRQDRRLEPGQLGSETTCPSLGCGLTLRVNPFVLRPPERVGT